MTPAVVCIAILLLVLIAIIVLQPHTLTMHLYLCRKYDAGYIIKHSTLHPKQ